MAAVRQYDSARSRGESRSWHPGRFDDIAGRGKHRANAQPRAHEHAALALQQSAGNKAVRQLFGSGMYATSAVSARRGEGGSVHRREAGPASRSTTPVRGSSALRLVASRLVAGSPVVQRDETHRGWNSLQTDFEHLTAKLLRLNQKAGLVGTRSHILARLHVLWASIGAPRPADGAMFRLRVKLDAFKADLRREAIFAQLHWRGIEQLYIDERKRLSGLPGTYNKLAVKYLDNQFEYSSQRVQAAGADVILDDIRGVQTVIANRSHLARAKNDAAAQIVDDAKRSPKRGEISTWPWPQFKATQLLAEGAEHGVHQAMHMLDSAVEHQIGNAARNMIEAGIPKQDVQAWTEAVRRDIVRKLKPVDRAVARGLQHGHKLTIRLKLFAYATVLFDIGVSTAEVIAAPPSQRPRLGAYHTGRIAGAVGGAAAGGTVGARLGSRFGVAGGIIGGLAGAALGGLGGAMVGKKTFVFVHDKIWPPDGSSVRIGAK